MIRPSASSNSGSWTGRIARPRSCQTKQPSQIEPRVSGSTTSSQLTAMPCWWNSGAISQNRSISRTASTKTATLSSSAGWRLTCRDSSTTNGATKCPTISVIPTARQPVCSRCMYQAISTGRLPDQMIRYCENEK